MKKNYSFMLLGTVFLLASSSFFFLDFSSTENENDILVKREKLENFVENSPFKETLKWDKKKRKQNGLPPNRYYEQMWELTINPATGQLDDGKLNDLRNSLKTKSFQQKSPGDATNAWEERGPNNVGGRTRVIMFDPNDSSNNTVYAGGVSGGLWKNTNISSSSSQWARVENVPGNLSVTSISVDPRNSNRWYVGTGEQYTAGDVVGNGVYVTNDGGNSWSAITIPAAGPDSFDFNASNLFLKGIYYVNDVLAWDNGSSTELFVAVGAQVYGDASNPRNYLGLQSSGIYRSTNGGSTWSRIESANLSHSFSGSDYYYIPNDFEVGADNKIWMGTIGSALGEGGGRVFSSTNGSTWTEAPASPLTDSNRVELEPSATNPNKIYALTQGVSSPLHIYQTTNGFSSITSRALPNDADTGIPANDFCRGQAFYDLVIEADPANDNIVYVGGIDLFKSTNSGSSWTQLSHWYGGFGQPNNVHADQHSIAFGNNSSSQILFGNDGGIYYSGNAGSTISVRNNNYNVTQFVKAGIGPDGVGDTNGIFSAGAQDNGTQAFRDGNTGPGINSSEYLSDGDGFYTFVDKDGQYMIATYVNNVIYRFNLPWNGQSRIQGGATTLLNSQTTGDFVNPMGYDSDANRLLTNGSAGTTYRITSINVDANSNGNLTNSALTSKPTAFRASPFQNNVWYVGLANGGLLRLSNVNNNSATFTTINNPFVGSVSSVRFGATANDLIVTIHNYGVTSVWYSSNGGSSWASKEGNLPNIPVRDILQNPLSPNEAILATQLGVWATENFNDSNPSWSQSYNGMSDVSVTAFDYWDVSGDDTNNKIIASTYGRGVFTGSFTTSSAPDSQAPTAPTALNATGFTDTTVSLSWAASTDNIGVSSYDILQGSTVVGNTANTSFTVNGLTANTSYSFSAKAKDAAGNVSNASNTVNVTTGDVQITYCDSQSSNVNDEFISRVQLNTIDNSSGAQFYSDFTGISTNLSKGSQYTVTVTPTWTGTKYPEGYSVWIDFNNNGDFTDSGEQVLSLAPNQDTTVSATFTVPTSASVASTRMRVSMSYDATPTSCQSFTYGEVEDYTVNIEAAAADTTAPVITLNGASTINLNYADTYNELGATATDNVDGDLTASIVISGSVDTNTVGSYTVNYNVSDAAGNAATQVSRTVIVSDNTAPIITLIGSTSVNLNVGDTYNELGATATDNVDGDLTASIVISGSVDTNTVGSYTVNYNVSDAAGNTATQVSRSVTVNSVSSGGCSGGVSTFPYAESFENTLGAWTQSSADDINWTVDASGTPSNGTGPSSAIDGSYYIFVEASGNGTGYPNKRAILDSPCFDLSSKTEANFSFNYHMYGSNNRMGSISLEASSDNGSSWTTIWSDTNANRGNTWLAVDVSLNQFTGGSVQLRFNRLTDDYWQADIAIDNVALTAGGSNNNGCSAEVTSFPYNEGFEGNIGGWTQDGADDLDWTVNSNGTPSNNTGPSSAIQGSSYIFVEASGNNVGYPTKQAILNSPCFDLSGLSNASFNFNYHMFGATNMGTIAVEASNDNGATWTSIWSESGNKGNQWLSASVDLSAYLGGTVQLRFNRVTGNTWQADIAIDNVNLSNTPATNTSSVLNTTIFGDNDSSFKIYPSPVQNILNIKLTTSTTNTYRIINSIGQVVKSGRLNNNSIQVSNLKIGIYILEINDGEETLVKKFIKR